MGAARLHEIGVLNGVLSIDSVLLIDITKWVAKHVLDDELLWV